MVESTIIIYLKNGNTVQLPNSYVDDFHDLTKQMSNWKSGINFRSRIWISKKEIISFEMIQTQQTI
jgi:hypothetical protein